MQYAVCIYQSVRGSRQTKADPVNKLALISSSSCPALALGLVTALHVQSYFITKESDFLAKRLIALHAVLP